MFLKKEHWPILKEATGYSDYQLLEWLKQLQIFSSTTRREWTSMELKVMAAMCLEGIRAPGICKVLNRSDRMVRWKMDKLPVNKEKQLERHKKELVWKNNWRKSHPEKMAASKAREPELQRKRRLEMRISKKAKQLKVLLKEFFANTTMIQEATPDFLKTDKGTMRLDFYLPQLKLAIEYDGEQHEKFVEMFHQDRAGFERAKVLDAVKAERCKQAGVNLIRFNHTERITKNLLLKKLKDIQTVDRWEIKS